jgi:epoxyqueuosine reductase
MNKTNYTKLVKQEALKLGFSGITVAKAEFMDDEAQRLDKWLNSEAHGEMSYLENHFDLRVDPRKLVPGAKSVISLMYNYHNPTLQTDPSAPKISQYAFGRDYHKVVKKKLKHLFNYIQESIGEVNGRYFVDSAPILERDWAKRSGLGWVGKHTLLLNKNKGSYFFLAEIICDLEFDYDNPIKDHCGTCRRCIEACPTDAISEEGYLMDGSKCISYLTIELKNDIPNEFAGKMANWMYGCDICQDVCPWNRFSKKHQEPDFEPSLELLSKTKEEWEALDEVVFDRLFNGSPVKRTKYWGLKRNINFLNIESKRLKD